MKRVKVLLIKELTQIRRDRSLFGILLAAPVIQIVVLGFAVTTDIRDIKLAVRDQDRTLQSREYVRTLASSGNFDTAMLSGPAEDDGGMLVSGRAGLVLEIPRDFGRRLIMGQPSPVQVLVDGADSSFAIQGLSYLQKATRLYSRRLVKPIAEDLARRTGVRIPEVQAESRAWFNPDLVSRNYTVPALMGLILMISTMVVTSMALVKEKEDGTMEQIIVTPLRPGELVAGKLLPFVVIGFIEVTIVLVLIRLAFQVPLRGSVPLLYAFSGLFLLSTLGLGTLVSTLVKTQQQAMMLAAFFVMMPSILLSGFIFPVENMPVAIQWIANLIPLKYYLVMVRGIFLKGAGMAELWREAVVLLLFGVVILSLAVLKLKRRLA